MRYKLSRQLILITITIFVIVTLSLGVILPKSLESVYEENVYNYLRQPQPFLRDDDNLVIENMAYIIITSNNTLVKSINFDEIVDEKITVVLSEIKDDKGKIKINGETFYYSVSSQFPSRKMITITNDFYITAMKEGIFLKVFPITLITFLITLMLLLIWSKKLVNKIEIIKDKVVNIKNKDYDHQMKIELEDEIYELENLVENTRLELLKHEKNKNEMFQNISHDLKTPITVIKSYIEAMEDRVENKKKGLKVIKEQTKKLNDKVESLLYLNKLEYLNEIDNNDFKKIDISKIITKSSKKFKVVNKNVKWNLELDNSKLNGTEEMWEVVIDNILENFLRYAKKQIKVSLKNERLELFNDGTKINEKLLNDIFKPYKKGVEGNFGLGLSIVKKTVNLFGYEIHIKNLEEGVMFVIE